MLGHGPHLLPSHSRPSPHSAFRGAPADSQHLADSKRLRRQVDQQRLALTHLSEALLGLRRGTRALREENRELRLELEALRSTKSDRAAGPVGRAHAERIDEILRRIPS